MIGALYRRAVALRVAMRRAAFVARLRLAARLRGVALELELGRDVAIGRGVAVELGGRSVRWTLGDGSAIADGVRFDLVDAVVEMGPRARIKRECLIHVYGGRLSFEGCGGLSQRCIVHCADAVSLGEWSAVSEYTTIVDSEHVVPSEPVNRNWLREGEVRTAPVRIGRYVMIGAKATILKGVTIGDHSIVGANSLVARDLPPHSVAVGVPARRVRRAEAPPDPADGA